MSINTVVLTGRLTADANRFKFTNSTKHTFSIAVDKRIKKGDSYEKVANFFEVEAWNVDFLNEALKKGRLVAVNGELDTGTYEKDGQTKRKVFIRANNIQAFHSAEKKEEPKPAPASNDDDIDWDIP